jgi:hypothetical protein
MTDATRGIRRTVLTALTGFGLLLPALPGRAGAESGSLRFDVLV